MRVDHTYILMAPPGGEAAKVTWRRREMGARGKRKTEGVKCFGGEEASTELARINEIFHGNIKKQSPDINMINGL